MVTDGVFSMTGRVADLPRIVALKQAIRLPPLPRRCPRVRRAGRAGPRDGRAARAWCRDIDLLFATFSKSLASIGGFVAGDKTVIEYLRHNVRTLIFSAALPPASVAAALAALHVMRRDPDIFRAHVGERRVLQGGRRGARLSHAGHEDADHPAVDRVGGR